MIIQEVKLLRKYSYYVEKEVKKTKGKSVPSHIILDEDRKSRKPHI